MLTLKPVVPGDQLLLNLKIIKEKRSILMMSAKAFVDDKLVAEAELMATFS